MPKHHDMVVNVGSERKVHLFSLGWRQGLRLALCQCTLTPRVISPYYAKFRACVERTQSGFSDIQKLSKYIGEEFVPKHFACRCAD